MLPVAILSGGLATRLRPITEKIPKALVEVAGKPFILWQLAYLKSQGVNKVVICTGYLGEMIEKMVGNGRDIGLEVIYSRDGPHLLGTGGALKQALPFLGDAFFVLYGDSFLPTSFSFVERSWHALEKPAVMTVLKNEGRWDKSNVLFHDGELIEYSKELPYPEMRHIDYGLGIISSDSLLASTDLKSFDLANYYQALSREGDLGGVEVFERFYEIGSHAGLKEADVFLGRYKL